MSLFTQSNSGAIASPLAAKMSELLMDAWNPTSPVAVASSYVPPHLRIPIPDTPNAIWGDGVASPVGHVESEAPNTVSPMKELVDIYRRLRDTIIKNDLQVLPALQAENSPNDLYHSDTLAQTLGISISSVEIQQRGIKAQSGLTLLDTIPQQAITHLRVLSETVSSYVSIGGIKYAGDNRVANEFCEAYERQYYQLFVREPYPAENWKGRNKQVVPLLDQDIFIFLTECTQCLAQVDELEIMHLVRLCYLAEIVKVVLKMGRLMDSSVWERAVGPTVNNGDDFTNFAAFYDVIWSRDKPNSQDIHDRRKMVVEHHGLAQARGFVQTYATAFLRKVIVLMHVRYGVAFHNHISTNPDAPE
jgi:E3 ubiquitin-protein ligase UBR1